MVGTVTYLRPLPTAQPSNSSIEQLFQEHYDQVFRTAYRVTGNTVDAEDVLQTVFLRVMRNKENPDLSPSPKSYLIRAAINAGLDIVRSRNRTKSVSIEQITDYPIDKIDFNPQTQQEDRELRKHIQKAIANLGEKAAEIFALRFLEGYDNREIAKILGMSQMVVAVILHRARAKVRKDLGKFLEELQ